MLPKQGCRRWMGSVGNCPSRFWKISYPYNNQREKIVPLTLLSTQSAFSSFLRPCKILRCFKHLETSTCYNWIPHQETIISFVLFASLSIYISIPGQQTITKSLLLALLNWSKLVYEPFGYNMYCQLRHIVTWSLAPWKLNEYDLSFKIINPFFDS